MNDFGNAGQQFGDLTSTNQENEAKGNSGLSLRIGIGASKSYSEHLLQRIGNADMGSQSTHFTDRIGGWIGRNPATGGKEEGSLFDSHSAYTGYLPHLGTLIEDGDTGEHVSLREITDKHWGEGNYSESKEVAPTRSQEGHEDEGDDSSRAYSSCAVTCGMQDRASLPSGGQLCSSCAAYLSCMDKAGFHYGE